MNVRSDSRFRPSKALSHVPYKSGPEGALAIASAERSPLVPNVLTIAEAGYPGFDVIAWYAVFAPRDTPPVVVDRLSKEIEKILRRDDVRTELARLGAEPHYLSPQGLTDYIAAESPKWGPLLKDIKASDN